MNGQRLTEQLQLVFTAAEEATSSTVAREDAEPVVAESPYPDQDPWAVLRLRIRTIPFSSAPSAFSAEAVASDHDLVRMMRESVERGRRE